MDPGKKKQCSASRKMMYLGFAQIPFGMIIAILGFTAVGMDKSDMDRMEMEEDKMELMYITMGLDCACVIAGFWIICTGLFPRFSCFHVEKTNVIFMIITTVTASLFVPAIFGSAIAGHVLRAGYGGKMMSVTVMMAVVSFLECIMAIAASAYCCCYYPWEVESVRSATWRKHVAEFVREQLEGRYTYENHKMAMEEREMEKTGMKMETNGMKVMRDNIYTHDNHMMAREEREMQKTGMKMETNGMKVMRDNIYTHDNHMMAREEQEMKKNGMNAIMRDNAY